MGSGTAGAFLKPPSVSVDVRDDAHGRHQGVHGHAREHQPPRFEWI